MAVNSEDSLESSKFLDLSGLTVADLANMPTKALGELMQQIIAEANDPEGATAGFSASI